MTGRVVRLADVCKLITKGTTPATLGHVLVDDGIPLVRVQNLTGGRVTIEKDGQFISQTTHEVLKRSKIFPGDVLISIAGTIGRTAYVGTEWAELNCNQAVAIIRPTAHIFAKYLMRWLGSDNCLSQIRKSQVTATISNLSLGEISRLCLILPPLAEQRRIAAILDQADELRRKRREARNVLDQLTRALISCINQIPRDQGRKKVKLAEFVDFQVGFPFASAEYSEENSDVKLCRGANILPDRVNWKDTAYWPKHAAKAYANFSLREDDIVLAMDRPWISEGLKVARVKQGDLPALLVQRVARLRPKDRRASAFILEVLKGPEFARHCKITETTIPHISPVEVREFEIPLLDESDLASIGEMFSEVDKLKAAHIAHLEKLDALFVSLQNRAFNGELSAPHAATKEFA